jgi:hypothetical protein
MTQQDIFTAALQITDPDARSVYLAQACGGDAGLPRRVEILLKTHESAGDVSPLKGMNLGGLDVSYTR